MPLVVPGINSSLGDKNNEWAQKLVGKKISESSSDTFAKKDLPENHRILRAGDPATMDFRPDRLNVLLDETDTVRDVNFG
ncbi:Peptidase inhibitor I78 family [Aspergillus sclerotialis]|uniref:Peptidase inhibitor I78 family n=1 Tax=Aspergillus sclerotialis TaxID=2070753 RepID=A0A3A3A4J5_9EURO|nr:Peptidase inhibitor I78 family [Aspergillus sclerotialis]